MSELERDPKVSGRYRELGAEEPPRELDSAILAAARREVEARPAPLVAPTGRRRWYVPLAAAAVIVLSVAVSWHMQLETPDMNGAIPPAEKAPAAPAPAVTKAPEPVVAQAPAAKAEVAKAEIAKPSAPAVAEARRFAADPAPRAAADKAQAPVEILASEQRAAASAARAPAEAVVAARSAPSAPAVERDDLRRERTDRVAALEMRAKRLAEAPETPEKALERIAELRRAGRHDEADKALAEFRKRYPDYKIPETMLERVERR